MGNKTTAVDARSVFAGSTLQIAFVCASNRFVWNASTLVRVSATLPGSTAIFAHSRLKCCICTHLNEVDVCERPQKNTKTRNKTTRSVIQRVCWRNDH